MTVYVLETGCYTNRGVVGVFRTAESAMASHHPERPANSRHPYEWRRHEYGWSFDAALDDDCADVYGYELLD